MSVTGVSPAARDALAAQIDRLIASGVLRGSESLCRLLRYLAERAMEHPGVAVKEYQIAVEVFGRPPDFDPRLDSTVRVQTGRLRAKLADYYAGEGADDRIIVEVPKGSYSLIIHERPAAEPESEAQPSAASPAELPRQTETLRPKTTVALIALSTVTVGLLAALLVVLFDNPLRPRPDAAVSEPVPAALKTFWAGFVDGPERPWVVFSNAEFVGRPETGMRYFDPSRDARTGILDHYTGVGEVLAVHELDRVFTLLHHGIRVKRGRLLSLDDAKNNDLIFIGSPAENLSLRDIPTTQEFAFRLAADGPRKGDLAIYNLNPRPGESSVFWASPTLPIAEDYAVIGLMPGMNPSRWVMVLAGTTTIGTQAAAEFVTRESNLAELVSRVGKSSAGQILPFEAVIHVKVVGGVPVTTRLVALHRRK
jgi:hypothetical protein